MYMYTYVYVYNARYASSGSAPLSDYMVQVSASSSFDTTSTATVRISSGNSAATVTYLLTEADVAFLAANTAYYVRANASNTVCVSVTVGVCVLPPSLWSCRVKMAIRQKNYRTVLTKHTQDCWVVPIHPMAKCHTLLRMKPDFI